MEAGTKLRVGDRGSDPGGGERGRGSAETSAVTPEVELEHQRRMLERIVTGQPLTPTLEAICAHVESSHPGTRCTVLLVERALGVLRHGASPSMPGRYVRQIDGLPVGEGMGVCGTAAARGEVVVVSDVAADPLTAPFRDLAERFGLASIWSLPLRRPGGEVIGTFAVYRSAPHTPSRAERETVAAAGNLVALALDLERSEQALHAAANLDALTGLLNRSRFLELVTEALGTGGGRVTVAMVQIDRFGRLNQSIGHVAGDRLLVEVAARLLAACGTRGPLARFSGDTFVLMSDASDARARRRLTDELERALSEQFHADGLELALTSSIGIATAGPGTSALALVREAETALQAARVDGPGHHQVYDRRMRAQQLHRLATESQLRRAIERGQLLIHYQPILRVVDRSWSGVEALVRWRHPHRGLLAPDEFIPLAEETGLIVPLGRSVLELVGAQAQAWADKLPGVAIAVNASALQLVQPGFADEVAAVIERAGLRPGSLVLEVTESALMAELGAARAVVTELQRLGVRVMIDDFGTGHSSLARLGELPIDGLKIDRRFARGLGRDPEAMPVVRAITELARAHGLEVVLEGIEDGEALAAVDTLRCEYAQGFHLAVPGDPESIEELLSHSPQVPASSWCEADQP